jgi:membrane protein YqaA with SNARE-associated domain
LKKLYDWIIKRSQRPGAVWWLAGISFAESSFFPVPPDILLVPMCLGKRDKAWFYGGLCVSASVVGGFLGYWIGYCLFESIGIKLLDFYGYQESFDRIVKEFQSWAFWAISIKGITPIPYKIVTIASGMAKVDFMVFLSASLIARSIRFFLLSGLCWRYGNLVESLIDNYFNKLAFGVLFLIIIGFVIVYFL